MYGRCGGKDLEVWHLYGNDACRPDMETTLFPGTTGINLTTTHRQAQNISLLTSSSPISFVQLSLPFYVHLNFITFPPSFICRYTFKTQWIGKCLLSLLFRRQRITTMQFSILSKAFMELTQCEEN